MKILRVIAYICFWFIIWGLISSIVDWALLRQNVYSIGSIGQYFTFIIYAIAFSFIGLKYSKRYISGHISDNEDK